MIRAEDIPDEVVEVAIYAVYAVAGGTQWDCYPEEAKYDDRKQMRAAIAAALNAWPRWKGCWDEDETGLHRCLLLPLPQKEGDE